ncbi:hypothetical protein R6Q59_006010 [Mikania micrantha]
MQQRNSGTSDRSKEGKFVEEIKDISTATYSVIHTYYKLEDAIKDYKAMHGKKIGGTMIHVDYCRSYYKHS